MIFGINDIPGITINIRFPSKSYCNMYGAEPRHNYFRCNGIPGVVDRAQNISGYNDKMKSINST